MRNDGLHQETETSPTGRLRILAVDDDEDFLSDLAALLSMHFDVETVSTTKAAMESIRKSPPDCLLLDINMPAHFGRRASEEGYAFLSRITAENTPLSHTKICLIILSASGPDEHTDKDRAFGVTARFTKPPDMKTLVSTIESNRPKKSEVEG